SFSFCLVSRQYATLTLFPYTTLFRSQIQQINAMVQAGAEAIVVFPISPTALNRVIKNACDKGVKIFAYDGEVTEPCAHNVAIDQDRKSTRLNSSHVKISYAVCCLKKK